MRGEPFGKTFSIVSALQLLNLLLRLFGCCERGNLLGEGTCHLGVGLRAQEESKSDIVALCIHRRLGLVELLVCELQVERRLRILRRSDLFGGPDRGL